MIQNKVLKRQLKRLKIDNFEDLNEEKFNKLLEKVDITYESIDQNVYRLERSLDISTSELRKFSDNLELKIQEEVEKNRLKDQQLINQSRFASMGEMIGNIAHQWRQPLSAISSTSSSAQLQLTLNIISQEELEKSFNNILKYTEFLSQTIDDFRNFLKSDCQRVEFSINDVISKTLNIVSSSYKEFHITISTFDESEKQLISTGFPSKLSQVFLNIFNNAKDASISNQQDEEKRRIHISYEEDSNFYNIVIQDNAGGIPTDIIEKVFDPYFTTKHQSQGTGIGLYMSRNIVEDCGGKIFVLNQTITHDDFVYTGACFHIILPKV